MNSAYFSAEFVISANKLSQLPPSLAEVAFAGRSNAGKSSAINAITRNHKLARTSKTPGRTQLMNYFTVAEEVYLVDLPGYGYAKVPASMRAHWKKTLQVYFAERKPLKGLVVVMDVRLPLTPQDWNMVEWSVQSGVALHILLTKADKLSRNAANAVLFKVRDELEAEGVEATLQLFSSLKKQGVADVHQVLDEWLMPATEA
ncbi:MAG: ribosome biogenesis GTP-binding protein YihA/YsxC [Gammaproteobacteria bacterium]|nr:ribosome biogenesis GTP-binding protein YihA/YsxC [Gammaproteobacteria bacterium]